VTGVGLLGCHSTGGGCEERSWNSLSTHREPHSQERRSQTPRDRHQQVRPRPWLGDQEMGQDLVSRVPHSRLPCLHHQCLWKGCPHQSLETVCQAPLSKTSSSLPLISLTLSSTGQETDLSWDHRLPEHWQELRDQCSHGEEMLQSCPHPWRDQGVAIHHPHEKNIPHRLPGCCL
jgi:hypothetical protein